MHVNVPADTANLGLSLQYAPIALAANIWHVLDVPVNSPADQAALLPYSDYILGSPEGAMHGEGALEELVEDHIGRPLRLYVYNNEYDVTREVTIQPSRDWGGEGALGCTLGYGALHRLPAPLSEPVHAPGEMMFDGGINEKSESQHPPPMDAPSNGADYLVPAQMVSATPKSAPPRGGRKKDRQHGQNPNKMMDDYFKEEEQKSKELDNAPVRGESGGPPPPKGAAGPPKATATTQSSSENDDDDE